MSNKIQANMRKEILKFRSSDDIDLLLSYNTTIEEIYSYLFLGKSCCELSYELQCAVFDINPTIYDEYTDNYFILSMKDLRVDKLLSHIQFPSNWDIVSFLSPYKYPRTLQVTES